MTHISLPENIEEIPQGCFYESGLEEIVIPRKMKKIGSTGDYAGVFEYCENLRSVVFEPGSELTEIGDNAFCECKSLRNIRLPDKLRKIGKEAFSRTSITEMWIPTNIQTGRSFAFPERAVVFRPEDYRPEGVLTSNMVRELLNKQQTKVFTVPENIIALDMCCFRGTNVEEVHIHENVQTIGFCAFEHCK